MNYVQQLFHNLHSTYGCTQTNPVTGARWVVGLDPISDQIQAAERAWRAHELFKAVGPAACNDLPLKPSSQADYKAQGGLPYLVEGFAVSWQQLGFRQHPAFEIYASGVLAFDQFAPDFILEDLALRKAYPPAALPGLEPGLIWNPQRAHLSVRDSSMKIIGLP